MTDQEKINFITEAFTRLFKKTPPEINRDMSIMDLGLDSLDIVELQMEFEKQYNVEVPDPVGEIRTVGNLLDHLNV
jgi:acyl carrier protein